MVNAVLSALCLLRTGLSHSGGRSTPPELLNSIVKALTMSSQLLGKLMYSSQHQAMMLVMELVAILGKMGSGTFKQPAGNSSNAVFNFQEYLSAQPLARLVGSHVVADIFRVHFTGHSPRNTSKVFSPRHAGLLESSPTGHHSSKAQGPQG
jgi:hypothetical protein